MINSNNNLVVRKEKIGFWIIEIIWFFLTALGIDLFITKPKSNVEISLVILLCINIVFLLWHRTLKLEFKEDHLIYRTLLGGKVEAKYKDIQRAYVKIGFNDMGFNRPIIRIEIEMKPESRQDNFFIKLGAFKESEWPVVFDKLNISEEDRDLKFLGKIQKFQIGKKKSKKKKS